MVRLGSSLSRRALAVSFLVSTLASASSLGVTHYVKGTITKVVDGDTIWVEPDKGETTSVPGATRLKIRMVGMDTPETHLPSPNGVVGQEPWGGKAATQLGKLIPVGTKVVVEDRGVDKYQRTLGRILKSDKDINLAMVQNGWASPYIICEGAACDSSFLEAENVQGYLDACNDAREAGRGIYSPSNPLKELPFEFRLRMGARDPDKWVGNIDTMEYYRPEEYQEVDECSRVFFMTKKGAEAAGFTEARK